MSAIIFDFDGTIADSFETVVTIFYELTGRREAVPSQEVQRLRSMTMTEAARELRVQPWKVPFMLIRGRRRMTKQIPHIDTFEGVPGVIRKLYDEGHQLFIVSSNSKKNIELFLRQHHMSKEFVTIYGSAGLLNKARLLKKVLRQNSLTTDETWYVGDEVRDVVGAKQAGLKVVAVSWGYNNAEILRQHEPTKLIETPAELLTLLEEI